MGKKRKTLPTQIELDVWVDTMRAAVDLLIAVEKSLDRGQAIPVRIWKKAQRMRQVFEDVGR